MAAESEAQQTSERSIGVLKSLPRSGLSRELLRPSPGPNNGQKAEA
eukprot:CAMPEP_0197878466 /NCGR_PEP_ID=MMETSP1439-20131203/6854_1 /TAXON_ID=66791 /ORGANISM="Gonyaulax spinifera, Strain CCMP409" /LENGTH=45 /DNA_ID= /DNA_START= /DNA_END= /DNA_ORIENTATION=